MLKGKKNGFTLVELMIVLAIFAIMIVGIIGAINKAYTYMNTTRLKARAINYAREGVEMMFNIRDTNRRKFSGEKDKYWKGGWDNGVYNLTQKISRSGDKYNESMGGNTTYQGQISSTDCYSNDDSFRGDRCSQTRMRGKISFTGEYKYLSGTQMVTGDVATLLGSEAEFYRLVRVFGVYCKNADDPNKPLGCNPNSDPKELRFCVKVFYRNNGNPHSTELCSVMTNFAK